MRGASERRSVGASSSCRSRAGKVEREQIFPASDSEAMKRETLAAAMLCFTAEARSGCGRDAEGPYERIIRGGIVFPFLCGPLRFFSAPLRWKIAPRKPSLRPGSGAAAPRSGAVALEPVRHFGGPQNPSTEGANPYQPRATPWVIGDKTIKALKGRPHHGAPLQGLAFSARKPRALPWAGIVRAVGARSLALRQSAVQAVGSGIVAARSDAIIPRSGMITPRSGMVIPMSGPVTPRSTAVTPGSDTISPWSGMATPGSGTITPRVGVAIPRSGTVTLWSGMIPPRSGPIAPRSGSSLQVPPGGFRHSHSTLPAA